MNKDEERTCFTNAGWMINDLYIRPFIQQSSMTNKMSYVRIFFFKIDLVGRYLSIRMVYQRRRTLLYVSNSQIQKP